MPRPINSPNSGEDRLYAVSESLKHVPKDHQSSMEYKKRADDCKVLDRERR